MRSLIFAAAIAAAALAAGGCTLTTSTGDQVVLTVQNAAPVVADQIKKGCAAYDANKVTAVALTDVATQAINNATVTGAAKTAKQIADDACPLIEALIKTQSVPKAAPASG